MRYIRESELRSFVHGVHKSTAGMIKEARERPEPHVFLSHSHLDRSAGLLSGAIALFDQLGAPAYLDYQDDALPTATSVTTAIQLRSRIDACPRMVVAASGQLSESLWVPWEIGYADGSKGLANVALMPIDTGAADVAIEQEYLAMYPSIRVESVSAKLEIVVFDPRDNKYWLLKEWLFNKIS